MSVTIDTRQAATLTELKTPTGDSRPSGDPVAPANSDGILRRLVERFAFIAFALYHLPLLLNNYPSLGGGGSSEKGLAISWGHVFTPPGVWVARHLFHMTGPMPYAYQGDNGDVGEEFGRLLLSILIAALGAAAWTFADRRRARGRWLGEALKVLLRYSIALGIASYAVSKLWREQFPPLFPTTLDQRVGDLTPMSLLWSFMQYSYPYSFFAGVMELAVVLLLCFRRTATLGALLCLAVMGNVAMLNIAYGVQVKLYATMIVLSAAVLVVYELPRLYAVFILNRVAVPALPSPLHERIATPVRWTVKFLVVGSVMLSSIVVARKFASGYSLPSTALDGGWVVTRQGANATSNSASAPRWRRIFMEPFGISIRLESDSLIYCQRAASAGSSTISLDCGADRKGTLRWTRTGNVVQLEGTFAGDPLSVTARHLEPSDYRLLRTKSRLIFDR
ncbi:MAG TPA: hypothetical protein VGH98_08750 [Gemmatimonadaceae bacterium]|jgi:hypothetical protein